MKKILVLSLTLLLAACACHNGCCKNPNRNGTCGCRTARCQKNKAAQAPVVAEAPATQETAVVTEPVKNVVRTEVAPVMYEGTVDVDKPVQVVHTATVSDCNTVVSEAPVVQEVVQPVVTEVAPETVVVPVTAVPALTCAQAGKCISQEPVVLKPRVTETVGGNKRPCCDDGLTDNAETYVPDAPEIYVIAANRTVNSMQDEAAPLFEQLGKIKVYVGDANPKSDDLPGGMDKGTETIRKRFSQMKDVIVVKNKFIADYSVESAADWYDTPTKTVPAIKYDISFKDRGGNLIGEWSEIIHQADGDRSWW